MRKYGSVSVDGVEVRIPYWNGGSSYTTSSGRVAFVGDGCELEFISSSSDADVVVRATGTNLSVSATIYGWVDDGGGFVSYLDVTPWVEACVGGYLYLTFTVDGTASGSYAVYCLYGIEPEANEVIVPPPYLPYSDDYDVVAFPLVNNQTEYISVYADDGEEEYECYISNRLLQITSTGGTKFHWCVGEGMEWNHYTQAIKLPNKCITINLGWIDRHGLTKAWVFEVTTRTEEVTDYVEVITGRGIGNMRRGSGTVVLGVRSAGCPSELRKWLSDIGTSPSVWWYRRYLNDSAQVATEQSPVTIESVEVDYTEERADFEATVNLMKMR